MKGLMVLSHGVEDVEALATRALLIRAGFEIKTVSLEASLIIKTSYNLEVTSNLNVSEVNVDEYDFIIVPGGPYVAKTIDHNDAMLKLITQFHNKGKVIAAICAGPRFLGRANLLNKVKYTAYPGSEIDAQDGYYMKDHKAYTDGKIITAKGAGTVYAFVYEIVKYFKGKNQAEALLKNIQH